MNVTVENALAELNEDPVRNASLIGSILEHPDRIASIERIGSAILMRQRIDKLWTYVSCPGENDIGAVAGALNEGDRHFFCVETWMIEALAGVRKIKWRTDCFRYHLPEDVKLPEAEATYVRMEHARLICDKWEHGDENDLSYIEERIASGVAAGFEEDGHLVGWALTHSDRSMGFFHVLDDFRRRGIGRLVAICLARRMRERGWTPYCYVLADNEKPRGVLEGLGFLRGRACAWFGIG